MNHDIKPGWYRSALRDLGYRVQVHVVHEGRVYFSRRELPGISVSNIESFVGIVRLPAMRLMVEEDLQGLG